MNLYALLIGINDYELSPLYQCVNDVYKIETYLQTLQDHYQDISIKKLIDNEATKATIITHIQDFLAGANNDDVVFLYYSGHGGLEEASNRFSDAYTNQIECMVCYHQQESENSDFLLADKELRYLFSKFKNTPHLITIFDCCHSGDIVRSLSLNNDQNTLQRKITDIFPARKYEDFIFSNEIDENELKSQKTSSWLSFKNSIHIAACLSSESSWEDAKGGVFTRYLLQLIKTRSNQINYMNIVKWSKISLKEITKKKQTPTISIQGKGKITQYSSWLNLYSDQSFHQQGQLIFNNKNGWYYDKGQLFGIESGTEITVKIAEGKSFKTTVTQVNLEDSMVKDPMEIGIQLDYTKSYFVTTEMLAAPLQISIGNLDENSKIEKEIRSFIEKFPNIEITNPEKASFSLTIFGNTISIHLPNNPYRPLATQIDIEEVSNNFLKENLTHQLKALVKWNYYATLTNPDSEFLSTPIKIEIRLDQNDDWKDITNVRHQIVPFMDRKTNIGEYYQQYQIKVTNISNQPVFVTALVLGSDMSISADPLDNTTKKIEPNEFVFFYEHYPSSYAGWSLDNYKEIYNWKHDWLQYKFIVNNHEDINGSIPDMTQSGLRPPITKDSVRGHGAITELIPQKATWDVYTTYLQLVNPSYNQLPTKLLENIKWYTSNKQVVPFINALYPSTKMSDLESLDTINVKKI